MKQKRSRFKVSERKFAEYIVRICLVCFGYYESRLLTRLHLTVLYVNSFLAGVGVIINLAVNGDRLEFSEKIQIVLYLGHLIRGLALRSAIMGNRESLAHLLNTAIHGFQPYSTLSGIPTTSMNDQLRLKGLYFKHIVFLHIMYGLIIFSPMFYILAGTITYPFDAVLLFPSWYPWKLNSLAVYMLTYTFEFITTNIVILPLVADLTVLFYFTQEVKLQGDFLCRTFMEAEKRTNRCYSRTLNENGKLLLARQKLLYDENFMPYFRECISHHTLLSRFINNVTHVQQWPFSLFAIFGTSFIAIDLYLFLTGTRNSDKVKYLMEASFASYYVFILCYTGIVLEQYNDKVQGTIYDMDWYNMSPKMIKRILILLIKSNRPPKIKFGYLHVASFNFFAAFMKVTYTYLNIFRQIE